MMYVREHGYGLFANTQIVRKLNEYFIVQDMPIRAFDLILSFLGRDENLLVYVHQGILYIVTLSSLGRVVMREVSFYLLVDTL